MILFLLIDVDWLLFPVPAACGMCLMSSLKKLYSYNVKWNNRQQFNIHKVTKQFNTIRLIKKNTKMYKFFSYIFILCLPFVQIAKYDKDNSSDMNLFTLCRQYNCKVEIILSLHEPSCQICP